MTLGTSTGLEELLVASNIGTVQSEEISHESVKDSEKSTNVPPDTSSNILPEVLQLPKSLELDSSSPPDEVNIPSLRVPSSVFDTIDIERATSARSWRQRYRDKGKEVERGRTLKRTITSSNPLARAESVSNRNQRLIQIDGRTILKRPHRSSTFHDDSTLSPALLGDNLLETCPKSGSDVSEIFDNAPARNTSHRYGLIDELHRSDSVDQDFGVSSPERERTTSFNDDRPMFLAPKSLPGSLAHMAPDISHLEYMALKASCPEWSESRVVSRVNSLAASISTRSPASSLPAEIIQQIFSHLSPANFNSARHVCRSWFITSLERSILETMLKRGGWYAGSQYDLTANHVLSSRHTVSDEWLMSKRISRECALGPDWKGNGLSKPGNAIKSALAQSSQVDFREVSVHHLGIETVGSIFIVSSCGKLLMVADGCLIYIYELNKSCRQEDGALQTDSGALHPVTCIICPRRVLACSMDTSSQRFAIAILLDGRMGMVCNISRKDLTGQVGPSKSSHKMKPYPSDKATALFCMDTHTEFRNDGSLIGPGLLQVSASFCSPEMLNRSVRYVDYESDVHNDGKFMNCEDGTSMAAQASTTSSSEMQPDFVVPSFLPGKQKASVSDGTMPIASGPRSLYRNICSDDDPPRSVAICPQRRCVAFGCSAGIELHWVDALTGQDLNRWFPLTAPSDFLFFLPPRKSVDSAKKLRLISSAAHPGERAAAIERAFGARSRSSPFWERVDLESQEVEGSIDILSELGSEDHCLGSTRNTSDHYRAIPLSDGYHILFTDPATNMLCLGSDAPVGGPTKLLRKIWLQNPEGKGKPLVYAGGSDLTWGVRVVAAFGTGEEQSIWLFSIPADVFVCNQDMHTSSTSFSLSDHMRVTTNTEWMKWWACEGLYEWSSRLHDPLPGFYPRRVWPLQIRGQEIGTCRGVVDLAIDSGPIMTVWAFSKTGVAKIWRINDGQDSPLRTTVIARDGTLHKVDTEGDHEMTDSSSSSPDILHPPFPLLRLDGADWSADTTATCSRFGRRGRTSCSTGPTANDDDGDIIMDHSVEAKPLEKQRNARFWAKYGWSEASYRGQIATAREDVVEDLAGIARIDLEIR